MSRNPPTLERVIIMSALSEKLTGKAKAAAETVTGWKYLWNFGSSEQPQIFSDRDRSEWTMGEWRNDGPGEIIPCQHGFHMSPTPGDAHKYVSGDVLAYVEARGDSSDDGNKSAHREMRILAVWSHSAFTAARHAILDSPEVVTLRTERDATLQTLLAEKSAAEKKAQDDFKAATADAKAEYDTAHDAYRAAIAAAQKAYDTATEKRNAVVLPAERVMYDAIHQAEENYYTAEATAREPYDLATDPNNAIKFLPAPDAVAEGFTFDPASL